MRQLNVDAVAHPGLALDQPSGGIAAHGVRRPVAAVDFQCAHELAFELVEYEGKVKDRIDQRRDQPMGLFQFGERLVGNADDTTALYPGAIDAENQVVGTRHVFVGQRNDFPDQLFPVDCFEGIRKHQVPGPARLLQELFQKHGGAQKQ